MGWKCLGSVWKWFGRCYTTGKSSRMDANVYGHRLRCSSDLRSRVWDVIEAHVVGRVRDLCCRRSSGPMGLDVLRAHVAGRVRVPCCGRCPRPILWNVLEAYDTGCVRSPCCRTCSGLMVSSSTANWLKRGERATGVRRRGDLIDRSPHLISLLS